MSTEVVPQPAGPPGAAQRGRLSDPEAERRVLGILIQYPEQVDRVIDRLKPHHFQDRVTRRVFEAILTLYGGHGRLSYSRVYDQLRKERAFPDIERVLLDLTESFTSPGELEPSTELLLAAYARRRLLEAAQAIEQMVLQETEGTVAEYQARAQEIIFEAAQEAAGLEEEVKDLMEILGRCYVRLMERREGTHSYGLLVRYPAIDYLTTGFKAKDLIILAGRPSMGKTALALNFAVNVAKRKVPVLIFSLEMDDEQIGDRIVISELFRLHQTGTPVSSLEYSTRMDDAKFAQTQSIFNELYPLPIKVIDRRGLTTAEMRAKARKVKAQNPGLGLIVIDYLQLIRPPRESTKNWALVVGDMVREIRDLAGELDLPVILLSQLNRGVESRENKRPVMSDLRDSGNIEEFADVVIFLYRDDYYYPERAREQGTEGEVEVIVAKQRKGPTGSAKLRFIREYTRFIEVTPEEEPR
ncbi:replicative DNA helicase [Limnochorda pilosa]|uniref:DNA 5'-3' helicase n=1 Tax=Limnochorda pilosa TaxID=1555112 RepID=A0A0K2SQZ1_LIMPI|nr:DnaB-like helicase C-terminal domain-containing protein [Limnochorda pilosa]BAS29427.1 helicase DnaB [Limnochorda pilosa]